ncbi:hypothetical protein LPJ66_012323, partial [Kickxella alabastrina]
LVTVKYAYTNQLILRLLWCMCTSWEAAVTLAVLVGVMQPENMWHVLAIFVSDTGAYAHYWSMVL